MPEDNFDDNEDFGDAILGSGSESKQDRAAQDDAELDLYSGVGGAADDSLEGAAVSSEEPRLQQQPTVALQQSSAVVSAHPASSTQARPPLAAAKSAVTPAGSSLYIGNLQWWTTDSELEILCSKYGQVQNIKTFEDKTTGKSKGYVLVQFATAEGQASCQAALNGQNINGKAAVVTAVQNHGSSKTAASTSAPLATTSGRSTALVRPGASMAQGRGNAPRPMANNRWQMNNGHVDGPVEPDQFFGGMLGFPNMSMGPQMGFGPPMGMGMGMGMGMQMGLGPMGPMAMHPMGMGNGMPGMFQPPPPPRDGDRRRGRSDFDDYDGSFKRGRF